MDTISRENNNYLPIAGVVLGVVAFALGAIALAKISGLSKKVPDGLAESIQRIDLVESEARNATSSAEKANNGISSLSRSSQDAFNAVASQIQEIRGKVDKMEEAAKAKAPAPGKAGAAKGPVVAGPGEYVVKGGDSGAKIARANGVTLGDLIAVNPGVNWNKLSVGQKIKLPKK